ncbi:MAG: flagellar hook-associated protein FlgK [Dethiobacteria bacterium]
MSSSTFGSFEIGRRAIHAQQKGVQVTGQNIANANTEGYSRQVVHMQALVPPAVPGVVTPPGYGVAISDITRLKSEFYGEQIMKALTAQHYWERLGQTMDGIEAIFQEPGENGINIYLNEFFDAWQELSANPESYAARISLREQAVSLTGLVRDIYARLDELKYDVEKELEAAVKQVNSLAAEITELNEKITYLQAMGQKSNEMLDERDLRLQELSKLVNIRVIERTNGSVEVLAGGRLLLHDDRSFELKVQIDEDGEGQAVIANSLGAEFSVEGGALKGMLESYNEVFPRYQGGLDELVYTLVQEVNEVHRGGYGLDGVTGERNFFANLRILLRNPADKSAFSHDRFAVAQSILEDPGQIAAA